MNSLHPEALSQLFLDARSHSAWLDKPVPAELLQQLYTLVSQAPTSANSQPGRLLFVQSAEAKQRLATALFPGNVEKTLQAPVTAVVAYDLQFFNELPRLFPMRDIRGMFADNPQVAESHAQGDSNRLSAYVIMAARALGLDAGPMGGFDRAKVDELFFAGTTWRSSLLINLGYGDASKLFPRLPRLPFAEAARVV